MTSANLPTSLLLNGREYAYAAIREYPARLDGPVNGYEARVLDFVRQWLTGSQEFTLTTSGSTGPPKSYPLRRRQLEASARRTADFFDLGPGDRALVCLNCEYIGGLMMLVRGLERNMHLTIVEPHADPFAAVPADAEFDFSACVPLQLQAALAAGRAPRLNRLKALLVGGAPADAALQQEIQPLTVPVWLTYGMTETCSHVALRRLNGPQGHGQLPGAAGHRGRAGRARLPHAARRRDRRPAHRHQRRGAAARRAHLRVAGPGRFRDKLGRRESAGREGRVSARRGPDRNWRAAPLLRGRPARRAPGPGRDGLHRRKTPNENQEDQLKTLLAERLGRYEVPRQLRYVPAFAATPNGKLDRAATLRPAGAGAGSK